MAEYIKRESIQKALKNVTDDPSCPLFLAAMIEQYIDQEPAADVVEVKHGKWIGKQLDNFRKYEVTCSNCGWIGIENYDSYNEPSDFNYCPNCGAKMDLEG